jgi:hypothetical protein
MKLKTLIARIISWIKDEAAHLRLTRLKTAAKADYDAIVSAAAKEYAAVSAAVRREADDEKARLTHAIAVMQDHLHALEAAL